MRKRQKKKNQKKYLPIIADEFNLLTMTADERNKAWKEYDAFREKHGFRKKYKDLKNANPLTYYFPVGRGINNIMNAESTIRKGISNVVKHHAAHVVTMTLEDFIGKELDDKCRNMA
ncbi:hypothetical protein [Terribacillus saccharophilus]|uniref:hypothetical protein n=1 Tax=Terribacillus saccharophilus TaxID=361277 RepID=UPI002989E607|nr:hypothetical protein [Terribacillus saccharophilus]MCM3227542.1 hypothetical protein [Terribacillus saccharophilus]